jgi:deoxyribodipyrimidine photo-lyase
MSSIWWIRRDLRLGDQPTLQAATAAGPVLALYVLDPVLLRAAAPRRREFLLANLRSLDADLRRLGGQLTVRTGRPAKVLRDVLEQTGAQSVFAEEDFTPYARRRDANVAQVCDLHLIQGQCLQPPDSVLKTDGTPYVVYTPYARAWRQRLPSPVSALPVPKKIQFLEGVDSEPIPAAGEPGQFLAGEAEAEERLRRFLQQRISDYGKRRDRMDLDGTSGLSPYVRFGVLSMRTLVAAALRAQAEAAGSAAQNSAETWLGELIWREFYIQILYHFPHVARAPFRAGFAGIQWNAQESEFQRWTNGETGVPIVDAGMRQLRETGWMHNRARMITASYLVKDLLINWQWGERWFMDNLIDGDPGANNGGWQWTAGTGTDAAPYFRIFNPVLQGKRFDPDGGYVRQWLPELAGLPAKSIHAPWEGGLVVPGYPQQPLVDHKSAIRRTRLAYEAAKDDSESKRIR